MKSVLLFLLSFITLSCAVCGLLMATQPNGSNLNLLASLLGPTPFRSFLIPGIILAVVVGGTNLLALIFNIRHQDNRYNWALAGGTLIAGWIFAQVILIRAANWLHFLFFGCGLIIILLSLRLKVKLKSKPTLM